MMHIEDWLKHVTLDFVFCSSRRDRRRTRTSSGQVVFDRKEFLCARRPETLETRALLSVDAVFVNNLVPGRSLSFWSELTNVNGTLFFAGGIDRSDGELWKSDGTVTGTMLVKRFPSEPLPSSLSELTNVNGTLFFTTIDGTNGRELWKSDGTPAGTMLVKDIQSGIRSSEPKDLVNVNGTLFFRASDGIQGYRVWRSDGTPAGTTVVSVGIYANPYLLTNVNGTLFFASNFGNFGHQLWKSDGTAAGTTLVKDLRKGSIPSSMVNVNGTLFFHANDGTTGIELWKSDGTSAGTTLVKDIETGSGSSFPEALTNVNGTLFFSVRRGYFVRELWKSDGTSAGTVVIQDGRSYGGWGPSQLTNVNGTLFFRAHDISNGSELWQSDGTSAGTALAEDIRRGAGSSFPGLLTNVNGTLFFIASDGKQGYELWMADVPSNTPVVHEPSVDPPIVDLPSVDQPTVSVPEISFLPPALVMDLIDGNGSSNPTSLTNVNGTLFFSTNDGTNGSELWKTDGTLAGTALVKDILSGSSGSTPSSLANVNGTLFFSASDGANGEELWKSDGTLAGTALVKDILSGIGSSNLDSLTNMNGTLFFTANDGTNGSELWRSDGTSAGTTLVKDIRSGSGSSTPRYLTNVNGTLYFSASDGADGSELWKSDGTSAGTTLVKDILSGSGSSLPRYLTNVNGMLFFRASNGVSGDELWQSDGTSAGTQLVRDIVSGIGTSNPRSLINANGTLYFSASNGVNGDELWQSDGTSTGTKLVRDIRSGSSGSSPSSLMNVNGMLFFSASNGVNGTELWQSDGTSAGTKLVRDIRNGGSGSSPSYLTNVNGALYFTANDGRNGVELWSMRLNERPRLTTFAAAVDIVDITADETEVELTFDELSVQGDESDADGTVVAFIVQSVSTGTLKIGTSAATAAPFAAGANDRIDATLKAYWMPVANVSGYVSAFSVAAEDDIRQPSVLPVTVTVTVTRTKPEILPPEPSYTSLQPIIRWFGVIGANSYEVWVKNLSTGASPFLTAILDRTATVTVDSFIPGVDLGIGTFRVWVRAKSGNVFSAWSLGRDFVITTAPTLNAIAPLQTTFRPTFRWSPLAGATRYEVWINNRTTGTSAVVRDSNVTATSFTVPSNLPVGNYRVWVRGISSDNAAADWSPPADFGIGVAPTITQGQNASFVRVPEIRWSVLPGATRYDVWIDNLSTGTSQIVRNTNVNSTTYTGPNNLPIGNYRAMVRGIAADGFVTAWTPAVNFKIDGAPTRIAGPSSTFDNKPTFAWNAVIGATKYEIFIRNVATGATTINQSGITTTQFTPGTALADGTHRWWVRAETAQGFQSLWSSGADIIIGGRTALLTPTGRTSDTTPTFTWQNVQGVLRYDLSVDRVGGQSQIIRQQSLTSATYTPATPLAKGTYRVWIRAISTTGRISVWSTPVDITIADNSLSPNGRHQLPGSIDAAESLLSPAYSEQTSVDSRHDETASEWAWFENHRVSATFDETDRSPKTAASDAAITPLQSNSDLSRALQPEENDETAVDALMSEAGSMNFLPGI